MLRGTVTSFCVVLVGAFATGCGGGLGSLNPPRDDETLLFGRIELPEGTSLDGIILYEFGVVYAPPFKSPPRARTWAGGHYLREGLPPGDYYPARFMAGGKVHHLGFGSEEEVRAVTRTLVPGKDVYMGTLTITNVTDPLFTPGSFDVVVGDGSREPEVLGQLIEAVQGTGWEERLKRTKDAL